MKLNEIKTAEELMRARYHAYETCDMEFIKESHDPDNTEGIDWAECEKWARESQWLGLEIISTTKGGEDDKDGIVEFKATYIENGKTIVHHERSYFVKKNGVWFYQKWLPITSTRINENKVGRNDPCPCGSGKKYKKCCGK
ncbi:YchJ family metal-binding protein [uncultured Fusobacterium sp.]|jgi:SEC-C motif-containing protein|uniref:YchJ family metal-binding protein n=1 Tax=uncultured Fusobacterium sp. TaxID=159267 RepID=UPI0025E53730|nr:YchJ family metal-binding protein [uncultured Fusobacterium sp.]MCF2639541.1 SEC-C domain-containing protein [Fusobacterium varium]